MPQWLKIVLILAAAAVAGLVLFVGGIVWWASANKDRLLDGGRAAQTEGEAFGRTHPKGECVDDALKRLETCGAVDLVCETMLKVRLASCMSAAKDDGTCANVPGAKDIMKSALWASAECARRGRGSSQACGRLMQGVVAACAKTGP